MRHFFVPCIALLILFFSAAAVTAALHAPVDIVAPGAELPAEFKIGFFPWPQPGGPGTPIYLTYSYSNLLDGGLGLSNADLRAATEEALGLWASNAPLHFTEIADAGLAPHDPPTPHPGKLPGEADIRIGHHLIDGSGTILAHAWLPFSPLHAIDADIHFDNAETWATAPGGGSFDVLEVMVHELGHSLALDHEPLPPTGNTAIMNPVYSASYSGLGTAFLHPDDIAGIQFMYGSGTGSVSPIPEAASVVIWALLGGLSVVVCRFRRRKQAA